LINKQKFDIAFHFNNPEESKKAMVKEYTFNRPESFDEGMEEIKRELNIKFN
jgi:hypothetical protein